MTPETARVLIEQERAANPHVIALARHLSIAVRVEVELLRAMRLRAMPWVEAGVEADLYFSSLVLARDVSAIAFYPEVRAELAAELAVHKDELDLARAVVEAAHSEMDAVILLEEMVTCEALRGDRTAHRSMQQRLGSVARELGKTAVDPDLLHWAATALPRMPLLARVSEAGLEVARRVDAGLVRLRGGTPTVAPATIVWPALKVGLRVTHGGVQLQHPAPEGWTAIGLPGPAPIQIEVGWPVPGGWQVQMVELLEGGAARTVADIPLGLIRIRAVNGDEIKLRVEGPFAGLKPTLLVLASSGTKLPGLDIPRDETEDMAWELERGWLPPAGPPQVLVLLGEHEDQRFDELAARLHEAGLVALQADSPQLTGQEQGRARIADAVYKGRAAVVLLSRDTVRRSSNDLRALASRSKADSSFSFHVLAPDDAPWSELERAIGPELYELCVKRQWAGQLGGLVEVLRRDLQVPPHAGAACLIDFAGPYWLSRYLDDLRARDSADTALPRQLDEFIAASRPVLIRVVMHVEVLPALAAPDPGAVDASPAAARYHHVVQVLDRLSHTLAQGPRRAAGDARVVLRRELLRGEQAVIAEWNERKTPQGREASAELRRWRELAPRPRPLVEPEKWTVFISYRAANLRWVTTLYDVLREHGHRVFLDRRVLKPGETIVQQLDDAISTSRAGILVWSSAAQDSEWMRREYEVMEDMSRRKRGFQFVTAVLDDSEPPLFARARIFLNFRDYPDGPLGGELLRLLHAIVAEPLNERAVHFAAEQDGLAHRMVAEVRAAVVGGDHVRLVELFNKGGLPWEISPALGCRVVEALIAGGHYDDALEILERLQARFDEAIRPRQIHALARARRRAPGDLERAQEILGELYDQGERDAETLGIYGRTWMDRYTQSGNPLDLRKSRDLYAEAFESAEDDFYTGINAASKSVLLGSAEDLEKGAVFARKVQQIVGTQPVPGDYWKTATVAEAFLIQKNYSEAGRVYEAAVAMAPTETFSNQSTWKQACRLLERLAPGTSERATIRKAFSHLPDCDRL